MVDRLSDHFYLEDVETLSTDQMLLTQLSIISSYTSLWYLFNSTLDEDWLWVLIGIVAYQLILLLLDAISSEFVRSKMVSLLKGELIAWFTVGVRAVMTFVFPKDYLNSLKLWPEYMKEKLSNDWDVTLIWVTIYCLGVVVLLVLLWIRIWKLWKYEHIERFWELEEFSLKLWRSNSADGRVQNANRKQRNRLMLICALTLGFIVSVTEAVSEWSPILNF